MSVSGSNWQFNPGDTKNYTRIFTKPNFYGTPTANCSCALTPFCVQPAQIGDNLTLPGLMVGCFPVESLLQSTLAVLYDQTMIDLIVNNSNAEFVALREKPRHQLNTSTVESMLSELMVEE